VPSSGSTPARGTLLAVRAAVLTAPACGAALCAHGVSGGCLSLLGAATAVVLCWSTAVILLGRPARAAKVLAWTLAAQALTHLALSATCGAVVHGHEALLTHLAAGLGAPIVLSHLGIALVSAQALSRADAGLWTAHRLLRAASRLRPGSLVERPVVVHPRKVMLTPQRGAEIAPVRNVAARLPVRRGPPARFA
jgi:hypothetical protein